MGEEIMNISSEEYGVLDKGFIRVVDVMGSDSDICRASNHALIKAFKPINTDSIKELIRYSGTSEFEMCEIKLHIKLPIFVIHQLVQYDCGNITLCPHANLDEVSDIYVPDEEQVKMRSEEATTRSLMMFNNVTESVNNVSNQAIEAGLNGGIDPEINAINYTLGKYTEIYWKLSARDIISFLQLHLHLSNNTLCGIKEYAKVIATIFNDWMPYSYEAVTDLIFSAKSFTETEWDIIGSLIDRSNLGSILAQSDLTASEKQILLDKLEV